MIYQHATRHPVRPHVEPVPCALRCYRVTLHCYHDVYLAVAARVDHEPADDGTDPAIPKGPASITNGSNGVAPLVLEVSR